MQSLKSTPIKNKGQLTSASHSTKTNLKLAKSSRKLKIIGLILFAFLVIAITSILVPEFRHATRNILNSPIVNTGPDVINDRGRTNILILGIGGEGHDGPNLTDTIILASYNQKTQNTNLISIPRDFWVESIQDKINAAYAFGQEKGEGIGIQQASDAVGEILGIPIHYVVRVDFNGFVKAIDELGGIDILVDKTFDDFQYPITGEENNLCGFRIENTPNDQGIIETKYLDATGSVVPAEPDPFTCRYEHLHFDAGLTHMNGTTALKYVRSRKGTNDENSDFARSKRQEKVISAVKDKIFSLEGVFNPAKILSLYNTFSNSIDTNIKTSEFPDFFKLFSNVKTGQISSTVISTEGDNPLLVNPPITNRYKLKYVLIPSSGSLDQIHQFIQNTLYPLPTPTPAGTN